MAPNPLHSHSTLICSSPSYGPQHAVEVSLYPQLFVCPMPDVVPALLPLSLRPLPPSFLPASLLPLLHLTLHHPICPYFPKLPHQTAGLMVSLGYSGKSPLLPVTLLTPSSKGPLCISTISSPLSASSPKFLSLGPPQSLASYMEKLMVSPQ